MIAVPAAPLAYMPMPGGVGHIPAVIIVMIDKYAGIRPAAFRADGGVVAIGMVRIMLGFRPAPGAYSPVILVVIPVLTVVKIMLEIESGIRRAAGGAHPRIVAQGVMVMPIVRGIIIRQGG